MIVVIMSKTRQTTLCWSLSIYTNHLWLLGKPSGQKCHEAILILLNPNGFSACVFLAELVFPCCVWAPPLSRLDSSFWSCLHTPIPPWLLHTNSTQHTLYIFRCAIHYTSQYTTIPLWLFGTLHTVNCVLGIHTVNCTLKPQNCKLHTTQCVVHTAHSVVEMAKSA